MNVRDEIIQIFEDNGINALDESQLVDIDSLQYITIMVEIEQKFNIILPDYFLEKDMMENFELFIDVVLDTINILNSDK